MTICQPPGFSFPLKDTQAAWDPDTRRAVRCLRARVEVKQAGNQTRGLSKERAQGEPGPGEGGAAGLSLQGHQHGSSVTETKPAGRASETRARDQEQLEGGSSRTLPPKQGFGQFLLMELEGACWAAPATFKALSPGTAGSSAYPAGGTAFPFKLMLWADLPCIWRRKKKQT